MSFHVNQNVLTIDYMDDTIVTVEPTMFYVVGPLLKPI